jgi:hypothetical protein
MRIGKLISAVLGVMLIVAGFGLTVGGSFAIALPGDDGWVESGPVRIRSDAAALLGDDVHIDLGHEATDGHTFVGWDAIPARVDVTSRNGKSVFIGVGPEHEVRAYLDGAAVDRVVWFDDDHRSTARLGTGEPADPTAQDFWLASTIDGTLEWDATDGEWAIVALNADGSSGIDIAVTGAAKVPFLRAIGVGALLIGITFIGGGITLAYFGVRRTPGTEPAAATPPAPPVPAA